MPKEPDAVASDELVDAIETDEAITDVVEADARHALGGSRAQGPFTLRVVGDDGSHDVAYSLGRGDAARIAAGVQLLDGQKLEVVNEETGAVTVREADGG